MPEVVHVSKRGRTVKLPSKYLPEVGVLCCLLKPSQQRHHLAATFSQRCKGCYLDDCCRCGWLDVGSCLHVCLSQQQLAALRQPECHAGQHVPQAQQLGLFCFKHG